MPITSWKPEDFASLQDEKEFLDATIAPEDDGEPEKPSPLKVDQTPPFRSLSNVPRIRRSIYDSVLQAFQTLPPLQNQRYKLLISDLNYADPEEYPISRWKEAVLRGETLARRLRGTLTLVDNDGNVVDRKTVTLAKVPYMTSQGTFIFDGTAYTLTNQFRLRPGVYHRVKANGEVEAHVNVLPGQGKSHRYFLEPQTGIFYVSIDQASFPLFPILRAFGATDEELRKSFGDDLYRVNAEAAKPNTIERLYARLMPDAPQNILPEEKAKKIVEKLSSARLDPSVMRMTLGHPWSNLNKDVLIRSASKLLQIGRGEAEPDDRDAIYFQYFMGPEDLIAERIRRAHADMRKALWRATTVGNLSRWPSDIATNEFRSLIFDSGLSQPHEQINPLHTFDQLYRVSRLGYGGIPSLESIPDEARNVHPTHLNYVDPVVTPENLKVGVDLRLSSVVRKGRDGKFYSLFVDPRTNRKVWLTPQQIATKTIALPGELESDLPMAAAIRNNRLTYVPKNEVDFVPFDYEYSYTALSNLVPMKSAAKAHRASMGVRFLVQALPLVEPESPLVRSATPENPNVSFDEKYSKLIGNIYARNVPGRVAKVTDNEIVVQYDDGTKEAYEYYTNFPFNRKTFIHNTVLVRPGDKVQPGQLLARSNYADANGDIAVGKNLRVAYIPFRGVNYEDAFVISESAAKKLTSEHMYQHTLPLSDEVVVKKSRYVSLYPSTYTREMLKKMDDDGVILPGTVVQYGDPLILTLRAKPLSYKRAYSPRGGAFADETIRWEHHVPGVVTDVAKTSKGINVIVKAAMPMQVGDKMAGRYGDKGVVAAIVPDEEMPRDENGVPFEVLANPQTLTTRCYDQETEFLTLRGWKSGEEVEDSDWLAVFDLNSSTVRWGQQIAPFHRELYSGPVLSCSSDAVDLVVTPNHTMWAFDGSSWNVISAAEMSREQMSMFAFDVSVEDRNPFSWLPNGRFRLVSLAPSDWKWLIYDGKIYCPSVETGFVVVRRKGKTVVSGNTNPSQAVEAVLGKIAIKTGSPYRVKDWETRPKRDLIEFAIEEAKKHNVPTSETIIDPQTGKRIPGVLTGMRYYLKLHHTSESKDQGRGIGGYTAEELPIRGGDEGSKKLALMDVNALLSHGATEVLRDAKLVRGQKNQEYWSLFMRGFNPPTPKVPLVYEKFLAQLQAAGINVVRSPNKLHVMALTDRDIDVLAENRNLKNAETIRWDNTLQPIAGGLFDLTYTGGHDGKRWAAIVLAERMPNPVMEEPIRRVLGLTESQFRNVLAGKEMLNDRTGPDAIFDALSRIDVDAEIRRAREDAMAASQSRRDAAIRRLAFLKAAKDTKIHPREWMLRRFPVLPPIFRPLSFIQQTGQQIVADANYLYRDMWNANEALKQLAGKVTDLADERLALYDSMKAVAGLGDPVQQKTRAKQIRGFLSQIFGHSPKYGFVQQKLLGVPVDLVGRAVVIPDPQFGLNEVGLPENRAWDVYFPFVIRRLVKKGIPPLQASEYVEKRNDVAREALLEEIKERPVLVNRAPVLHRFGLQAFWPKLVPGDVLRVNPFIVAGFGMDFDGDTSNYHVPATEEAKKEAIAKMLPSRNLIDVSQFRVHYLPRQEYIAGLYEATASANMKKARRTFATGRDVVRAFFNGELDVDQPVSVINP